MADLLFLASFFAILLIPCLVAARSVCRPELEPKDEAPGGRLVPDQAATANIRQLRSTAVYGNQDVIGDFGALQEEYRREEARVLAICRGINQVA
jgi:hypothetical protein